MTERKTRYKNVSFLSYQPQFDKILSLNPLVSLLAESQDGQPLYHEACVYDPRSRSIFVTSSQLPTETQCANSSTSNKTIKLSRIYDTSPDEREKQASKDLTATVHEVTGPKIPSAMLNGGVNYGSDKILFCAQGTKNPDDLSGLLMLSIPESEQTSPSLSWLLESFHGTRFNSTNDVVVHPKDGSVWFTDPTYGYYQGISHPPQLPNQVYRFDPKMNSIRVVADGFVRPNGLCFSPDLKTLYITDTGAIHGSPDVPIDPTGPSHIYAFDIVYPEPTSTTEPSRLTEPFLVNRRTFAFAPGRLPDGIKCDMQGNVYSGCGDGIEVWDQYGVLLGVIQIKGGVANFCFGEKGVIYACNETRLWKIWLDAEVRGALLGLWQ